MNIINLKMYTYTLTYTHKTHYQSSGVAPQYRIAGENQPLIVLNWPDLLRSWILLMLFISFLICFAPVTFRTDFLWDILALVSLTKVVNMLLVMGWPSIVHLGDLECALPQHCNYCQWSLEVDPIRVEDSQAWITTAYSGYTPQCTSVLC